MKNQNRIIILLGSNIRPEENLKEALALLAKYSKIKACSRIWRTEAIGSDGPDFLNMAVDLETDLDSLEIKSRIIKNIEIRLGRVRTEDKNAPRTIDLDIILLNDEVLDDDLWKKAFVALPVSELRPNLINPKSGVSLKEYAEKSKSSTRVELFDDHAC